MTSKIIGSGNCIPSLKITNSHFNNHIFLDINGSVLKDNNQIIQKKLQLITGISERKYANNSQVSSDLGFIAAQKAIEDAQIDPESLDYIIFAHNFGDVHHSSNQMDSVPSLAARVKNKLKIKNNFCVAYDLLFGCPGWIEAFIQANSFIKSGLAKRCLVIGAETLSRVVDEHDRDTMIYSDGAGAVVIEATEEDKGILSHISASHTLEELDYLYLGTSNNKDKECSTKYLKMNGRKIYEFALTNVPSAMKMCLDKADVEIKDLKKIIIHQANEKMDEEILKRFYKLYDYPIPDHIMPMVISTLGNSSVATVPSLLSMVLHDELENHKLESGDVILLASVGAGMNINSILYKI